MDGIKNINGLEICASSLTGIIRFPSTAEAGLREAKIRAISCTENPVGMGKRTETCAQRFSASPSEPLCAPGGTFVSSGLIPSALTIDRCPSSRAPAWAVWRSRRTAPRSDRAPWTATASPRGDDDRGTVKGKGAWYNGAPSIAPYFWQRFFEPRR